MKRPARSLVLVLGLAVAPLLASCGDEQDAGYPPEISALTYSPETATAGGNLTVSGTVQFADRDGDVERYAASVSTPAGFADLEPQRLQGASGLTAGVVQFTLIIAAPTAGTYTFQVYLIDSPGNHSNVLQGTIDVQ